MKNLKEFLPLWKFIKDSRWKFILASIFILIVGMIYLPTYISSSVKSALKVSEK
jgi:hypothetical protein